MKIYPENYELVFDVDLKNFKFIGKETITLVVKEKTKKIVLDAAELKISKCQMIGRKNENIHFELDEKSEKFIIKKYLKKGKYKILIEFEGILNDKLVGFYRSRYESDGKEKYLATTHFEPADARRAFPCFDNPAYKATFDISLIIDRNMTAISNMLPIEEKIVGEKKHIRFSRTPKMSTYLVYLGVGEFEFLEDKLKDTLIRIVATHGKIAAAKFALDCTKKFLKYYEDYFEFPYPLPKLDIIAIPDFAPSAMENWGAITFRENAILFYAGKSSLTTKQRIAEVISHEIVHQWFGNLVTMKWWDDLWLNESFATFMAYKALDYHLPEWEVWTQYILDAVFDGMSIDSLKSTHPIKVNINKTSEIDEIFDEISYDKGGSILRMIENYLGDETFRKGMINYISKFQYQNAEAKDLWKELENVSKKPVLEIMKKFITQPGFPKINVKISRNKLNITQKRFLLEDNGKNFLWSIPLVIQFGESKVIREVMNKSKQSIILQEKPKFVNANLNYTGFYISEYGTEYLDVLCKNLAQNKDRLGIVHDLFYLVLSGKRNLSELPQIIEKHFLTEKDSAVGLYIIGIFRILDHFLEANEIKHLSVKFSKNILDNLGFEPRQNENPLDAALRSAALSALAFFDEREAIKFAQEKFSLYLKDEKTLHPDLRAFIYSSAVWSDDKNYSIVLNLYKKTNVQEEKAKLLAALAKTKNINFIKKSLDYSLTKEVRFAHLPYIVSSACDNIYAKKIMAQWLMKNWIKLVKTAGRAAHPIIRNIIKISIPFCGIGMEKELEKFFKKQDTTGLEKTIAQAFERLRIYSKFAARYKNSKLQL